MMRKLAMGRADITVLSPQTSPHAEHVVTVPPRFTGRDSVTVRRDRIRSVRSDASAITLLGGAEIELRPADDATLDELADVLFGLDATRFRALAALLGGRERFAPGAVSGVDREFRELGALTVYLADGSQAKRQFGTDFETYRRVVASLYGPDTPVTVWTAPPLSPRAAAALKQQQETQERKRKEWEADRRETEARRAEEEKAKIAARRFRMADGSGVPAA